MATVTVIPEPWEHPCAGEQAWEAASGLQMWPWAKRNRGLELGVPQASAVPPALELLPTCVLQGSHKPWVQLSTLLMVDGAS